MRIKANSSKYLISDRMFDTINYIILVFILVIVVYPLYFVVIASFSDPNQVNMGKVWILPTGFNLEGYKRVFSDSHIMISYINTIIYTVTGTALSVSVTITGAYALSRNDFYLGKPIMFMVLITMFFSGGLIPTFLVVKELDLINNIWSIILPSAVSSYNLIIARTYFSTSIPKELLEAAKIDGCNNTRFFIKIVVPISSSIIAIMCLYYGVSYWNSYFNALIYLSDVNKFPLQLVLREILVQNQLRSEMVMDSDTLASQQMLSETIKYASIIISSVPVLIVYPFIQRYFIKGVMIGAVKG